mmetsp:Transcript_139558/g.446576  ORF Transcript_139558/g.446576 Transcript_139558/m.446576 type:complete len:202 (-) Transcript_139558:84-689(-)
MRLGRAWSHLRCFCQRLAYNSFQSLATGSAGEDAAAASSKADGGSSKRSSSSRRAHCGAKALDAGDLPGDAAETEGEAGCDAGRTAGDEELERTEHIIDGKVKSHKHSHNSPSCRRRAMLTDLPRVSQRQSSAGPEHPSTRFHSSKGSGNLSSNDCASPISKDSNRFGMSMPEEGLALHAASARFDVLCSRCGTVSPFRPF